MKRTPWPESRFKKMSDAVAPPYFEAFGPKRRHSAVATVFRGATQRYRSTATSNTITRIRPKPPLG